MAIGSSPDTMTAFVHHFPGFVFTGSTEFATALCEQVHIVLFQYLAFTLALAVCIALALCRLCVDIYVWQLLLLCNSPTSSIRRSGTAIIYLLLRKNFLRTKSSRAQAGFPRMKIQITIALSRVRTASCAVAVLLA